jgi:hypothetical protein
LVAGDLVRRFARQIEDESVKGVLFLDYNWIAKTLAAADPEAKSSDDDMAHGMWERYAYHFQNQSKRRKFLSEIELIAKQYLADTVFRQAYAAVHGSKMAPKSFWDETLLHPSTAPYVLRQWITDSARTRKFLTTLFQHFADIYRKGSIVRRAVIAVTTADRFGWRPLKITEVLVKTGDINLGEHTQRAKKAYLRHRANTVGWSIHRMRKADEDRRAKMNTERRRERAIDRAAVKRARLLKAALA